MSMSAQNNTTVAGGGSGGGSDDASQQDGTRFVSMRQAATLKVRAVYEKLFGYDDVDTEFAVAGADTVLHLQSRPVVALGTKEILTVDRRAARSRVVAKGSYSLLGAVTGTCRVIRNFEDLISGNLRISRSTKSRGAKN